MARRLALFDVDGTLVSSTGANANAVHKAAFAHAWKHCFGITTDVEEVKHHGSTDQLILQAVLEKHGVSRAESEAKMAHLCDAMCEYVEAHATDIHLEVLPGARELLATLRLRGIDLTNLTPPEFKGYFGNGYAVTRAFLEEDRDVVEGFGRAIVRGMRFGNDPANREATLENAKIGNPQVMEDREFASALFDTYIQLTSPAFPDKGFGYQHPENWERWQTTLVDSGDLDAPLPDLTKAYTNEFIGIWNAAE